MLIVTMGVLTLLAVLGTTFVSLMRLEKKATQNYIDSQIVDLVNQKMSLARSDLIRLDVDTTPGKPMRTSMPVLNFTSWFRCFSMDPPPVSTMPALSLSM